MYCFLVASRRFWRIGLLAGLLAVADIAATTVSGAPSALVQSAVAQAPARGTERPTPPAPVAAPVVESEPPPVGSKPKGAPGALWVLAGGIVVVMGFVLFRILTVKPQAVPTVREDENARVRRHQHRRGQGRTPASREEQRISETSRDEFMNAPMRQAAAEASGPKPDASETTP